MTWLYTGMLLGSIVTSSHDSEEACRGRAAMLAKKDVVGQCVQQSQNFTTGIYSANITCLNGPCK